MVTFDTPEAGEVTPQEMEKVRAVLYATVRGNTEPATHVTVTQQKGLPAHPFLPPCPHPERN